MSLDLHSLLNKEQAEAASVTRGPLLVIAGAGSGKTRMITYRIAAMLESGIDETQILALTFTNKAAKEMAGRIREVTGRKLKGLTATTFHSFGLGILKRFIHRIGYRNDFTLYDENDNTSLIRSAIAAKGLDLSTYNANALRSSFSDFKTGRSVLPEKGTAVREIYDEWLLTQKAYNVVDFDDLILLPLKIFESNPDVLEQIQLKYRYITVDEFQDTSLLQYRLVASIASRYRNICVVGDDDQSIYSWRGANYRNIMEFEKDFPERKEFRLERNYRSSGNILHAANAIIVNNTERKDKSLWTESGEGALLSLKEHPTAQAEAMWIVTTVRRLMADRKYRFSDFGILVRTNALAPLVETSLVEAGIPVTVSGGSSFFDRKEVRDMLCYLKAIVNRDDDNSLLRIINTPRRGIGRTTVEKLRAWADSNSTSLYDAILANTASPSFRENTRNAMKDFVRLMEKWRSRTGAPSTLVSDISRDVRYVDMVMEEFPDSDKAVAFRMKGIEFLSQRLSAYIKENPSEGLSGYLHSVSVLGDEKDDESSSVSLMTMHAAKGLEFRCVIIAGTEDNIIPSSRALEENPENIEEERRLFYVALTRAKERLYISSSTTRRDREGKERSALPSRFISEIPSELFVTEDNEKNELEKSSRERSRLLLEKMKAKYKK